jgi:hypothetical protein
VSPACVSDADLTRASALTRGGQEEGASEAGQEGAPTAHARAGPRAKEELMDPDDTQGVLPFRRWARSSGSSTGRPCLRRRLFRIPVGRRTLARRRSWRSRRDSFSASGVCRRSGSRVRYRFGGVRRNVAGRPRNAACRQPRIPTFARSSAVVGKAREVRSGLRRRTRTADLHSTTAHRTRASSVKR